MPTKPSASISDLIGITVELRHVTVIKIDRDWAVCGVTAGDVCCARDARKVA